jgi:succinyl-CoA synthetase beta subunit
MLGEHLVTHQTTADGQYCSKVAVLKSIPQEGMRETYFAIVMDRDSQCPVMMASPDGGMNIEEVAEKTPERITHEKVDLAKGLQPEQTMRLANFLGFEGAKAEDAAKQMEGLYNMFIDVDATQVEINPLAETCDGEIICVDAKVNFDDNAFFRQKEIFSWGDDTQEDPRDVAANKAGVNYIGLDGNSACRVNGAGLAMATMDIIKMNGGEPANFLDLGGGVTEEICVDAFKILTGDPTVKGILINVFGGIVRCDVIAEGIITAAKVCDLSIPLVVRLEGTNSIEGKALLDASDVNLITAVDLDDAARKVIAAV